MELFPDGGFVRLQSRGTGKFVHADRDWEGVSLRPLGSGTAAASLESVWRVQHVSVYEEVLRPPPPRFPGAPASVWRPLHVPVTQEVVFVLLHNAAYGRYLASSHHRARRGHVGRRAVQADRNEPPDNALPNDVTRYTCRWWWKVERVVDSDQEDYVCLLRSANTQFGLLRANGKHLHWNTGVTVDRSRGPGLTTMMQWTVHAVPPSPVPLPLPDAPPQHLQIQKGRRGLLFWRRTRNSGPGVKQHPARTIRYVRESDEGHFDQDHRNWPTFACYDHSVINLRTQLGQLQNDRDGDMLGFTLCIRSGMHGRLMPLVTDLPRSLDPMNIVVLRTGSQAAAALVYPQIDAQAQ